MSAKKLGASRKQVKMRVFFDLGSQKSFIHLSLVGKLNITPTHSTAIGLSVFGRDPVSARCPVVELKIALSKKVAIVKFLVTDKVSTTIDSTGLAATVVDLQQEGVRLADLNANNEMDDVQVVIGADYLEKFVSGMTRISGVNLLCSPGGHIIYEALPHGALGRGGRSPIKE